MTISVRRWRIGRRVASEGGRGQPSAGREPFRRLAAAFAGLAALSSASASFAQTPPPGMVRYDHPVLHNGHLLLWHGAWRDRVRPKAQSQTQSKSQGENQTRSIAAPASAPSPAPAAKQPHEFTVLADPDDSCASRLATEFAAAVRVEGAGGRVVAGGVSATALAAAVAGDRADLAIAPLDALVADPQTSTGWRERAPFIARLSAEPVEIIASRDIADARQLAGRDVGYGPADGAGAASATILFSALGVAPRPAYAPLASQLADLSAGKLAAVVAIDGRCSKAIAGFGADRRFHEIAVRWSPALKTLYAPARLTAKDRPNLIEAEEKIDTVGAPRALIALDAAPDTPRAMAAAAAAKSFFEGFDRLLEFGQGRRLAHRQPRGERAVAAPQGGAGLDRRRRPDRQSLARRVPRRRAQRGDRRGRPGGPGFRSALRQFDALAWDRTIKGGA